MSDNVRRFIVEINRMSTPPAVHPYEALLARAVDISSQTRSGLYDCLYVALADFWFANWYGPVVKQGFTQPGA